MLDGICRFALEANWILDTHYYHTGLLPDSWEGDGIICMLHAPRRNPKLTAFIRAQRQRAVVDLSCNDPSVELPRVLQDNRGIGRAGAEHLASLGCRHLGFVMQGTNHFHSERYEGFKQAAMDLGLSSSLHRAPKSLKAGAQDPSWLLQRLPVGEMGTLGVMMAADYLARWVVQACELADLSIPNDLALLGVDNSREFCELGPISLSSIGNNAFQHGYQAAHLLQRLLDGELPPQEPLLVPKGALHPRHSTDIIAAKHPHVATVMRHIADHFTDPNLTPGLITSRIPMSDRRLHDAFVRHIGRSMHEELVERRVQHALRLVKQSDRKLSDIAQNSGFKSPETMSRLFQRNLGHPPSHFRKPG
ncbi:MAG: AraC family transcriptional regulator [Luteolibacter sp.]